MSQRVMELLLIFTSVLFIVDPFAVIPTFLAMTARDSPEQRRVLARRGAWTCAITLTAFALGGSMIFKIFGITIGAFKIAGGVLMGLNALDMVQARRSQQRETPVETAEGIQKDDIGILPLGVPMLAGPGAISTVMVLALGAKTIAATAAVYVAIVLTSLITYFVLSGASLVERRLGQTGMRILTRLMGLVLSAIAVQFILDGIKLSFL
ncbi:MAG TPA: MarC family protein, partial [Gemmatimonadales bacterium]|nr:MarC family protein [Gemmatimonadales bacterium]